MLVRELVLQYLPRRGVGWDHRTPLTAAAAAAEVSTRIWGHEAVEVFGVLLLNAKYRLLGFHEVSRGSLEATVVHPREVFKAAILANAASVIACHYVARHIMALMCR